MKLLTKVLKITGIVSVVLILVCYWVFVTFTTPKSDNEVLEVFTKSAIQPKLTKEKFKGFEYRKLEIKSDTVLPTIVFVHGTIGSSTDFSKYMLDSLLQAKANFISYDRIGYNYNDKNDVQESIAFENALLLNVTKNLNKDNTILVGYSFGGPIALATKEKFKKVVLCAPAVYSKAEFMPWALNFYQWKLTRWLVPTIWKQASKEKLSHAKDLENFENNWNTSPNNIISIHGTTDWIVPLSNSEFLEKQFNSEQFKLVTIENAGHELIWSHFDFIKKQLLIHLD
ncbi:pimeloyl-ACP methyl ester carboxylesterase [Lutibacter sp. Hel_I_33_5]|uniref:alpha/beta fold hydrolase n=1 Tax=Lutibacter sp. Hel_I_33_5 TaxID=1566289 RepID=UPI00119E8E66|nr:alpha/beta fold hydrolase [Lutibacter sp. Hel_I_33_5]TVZ55461.1 pimeloyl-ACP methyl ester carboxylesterase [Lutibacter sp. Hel_I_33_5]